MLDSQSLLAAIAADYEALPATLRQVARWVLDHPDEVALISSRAQAARLGVAPATLTRFAKALGLSGYNELRAVLQQHLRARDAFAPGASRMVAELRQRGGQGIAESLLGAATSNLEGLREPDSTARLDAAAALLAKARRVFAMGSRSSFPVAYQFHYIARLGGLNSVLVDGAGGAGVDVLRDIGKGDVMLAVSVEPYARLTIEYASHVVAQGARLVAITDSPVSPLARLASASVLVGTGTAAFFHSMSAAFAAGESLAALAVAKRGPKAIEAVRAADAQLQALTTYLDTPARAGHSSRRSR